MDWYTDYALHEGLYVGYNFINKPEEGRSDGLAFLFPVETQVISIRQNFAYNQATYTVPSFWRDFFFSEN